jgi:tetratricopeptide (TPR) repeat protein
MMKSILITLLIVMSISAMAQDIDEIRKQVSKNDWVKAKENIDKYVANEKNAKKGDGWFWKAHIYDAMARDSAYQSTAFEKRQEAFAAYKKYLEVDTKQLEGTMYQHSPLFDVAFGYNETGRLAFNSKNYDVALLNFRAAEPVQEFIVGKGFSNGTFSFPAYDTQLYLNIAAAAINAKKEDVAVQYYQRIADKKLKADQYDQIYRYIVDYYDRTGDKTNTQKYLAIGREVYPKDEYWCEVGLKPLENDKPKLFAHYESLLNGPCDNYLTRYNYGVEMYNYADVGDTKPADATAIQKRFEDVMTKATTMKEAPVEANMLMARHYFAAINALGGDFDKITGTKPDDIKKKNDINAQIIKQYDNVFPYVNYLFGYYEAKKGALKTSEKGQFKIVGSMMQEYWEAKKDKVKQKEYTDRQKAAEM